MQKRLVIFDSHPVQYRVPIWKSIEAALPGQIHVVYASDCSVRGHNDKEFGQTIAWDDPMLEGYNYTVLNCEKGVPLSGFDSLTGEGVARCIEELKPDVILLTGLNYRYDRVALKEARKRHIPVWLRCETQDEAMVRSKLKSVLRSVLYRIWYRGFSKFFYIGELNRQHYLRHGVHTGKLLPACYGTVDRFENMSTEEKDHLRNKTRHDAGIKDDSLVIGFSGKFIDKKNPVSLYMMLDYMPEELRNKVHLYFIGSGELKNELEQQAVVAKEKYGVQSTFAGFVNQSELPGHYLAMDMLVLPSKRMGETWGLVSNEAMQAGCAVVVSNAAGCYANFTGWERFRVFREGDFSDLAQQVKDLSSYRRAYDWATSGLRPYSIEAIAAAFVKELKG